MTIKGQMDIPCVISTCQLVQNILVAELPDLIAIVGMDFIYAYQATWDWCDGGCLAYGVDRDHSCSALNLGRK